MKTEEASRVLFLLLVVFGITYCVRIYGPGERYVAALNTLSDILLVLVASAVAWLVYRWLIRLLLAWVEDVSDGRGASAYPLMVLLGSIAVVMADTYYILVSLGVSSSVATLSASITGFAVSFGAQSTLSQFFNGMMLLATHPFEVGDVVVLNNDGVRLIVRRIGVMTTVFEDWNTGTRITVPNDRVSKSSIQNVTSRTGAYAFVMSLNVSYDLDFQKARGVILEVLEGNPHVIKDPEHRPTVTLDQFLDNMASVKITTFIDDYMNHAAITSEIRESIVAAFHDNGLSMTHMSGSRSSGASRYRAPRVRGLPPVSNGASGGCVVCAERRRPGPDDEAQSLIAVNLRQDGSVGVVVVDGGGHPESVGSLRVQVIEPLLGYEQLQGVVFRAARDRMIPPPRTSSCSSRGRLSSSSIVSTALSQIQDRDV